ncbi:D-alanyl-D-alanine carboxypeptidase family protein [uncultured Tateyamaria sp.]|uniref:D-alanyl-D-alanine carboxypeptidase family protein n=1 Tax=uncultured Tateyamaria sp. TaxID=455651 RepID=UPI00260F09BF|nr:D-alanyl-D-alanine carboxypeptidase family protein [uncultured Tateyamaria sp.]
MLVFVPVSVLAAPYAAFVMDARTGEVLHSRNADTRLHPASLTKMMTLYVVFQAVERGEITLDTKVKISAKAASEPPSKLGLKAGSRIKLRYLIRASAVKSANDAATAMAEAISGSEAAFARRMNRTAASLGMTRTTFKNAHGLTESGHMSTARDMSIMGRHMIYDYPQYYNLFSRTSTHAGIRDVANTNRRLLGAYKGADGIKTGYTRAAGFNLVASAERGNERIIATVFGGKSTVSRNAKVAELLDLGFRRAPSRAPLRKPQKPNYVPGDEPVVVAGNQNAPKGAGKIIRLSGAVKTSYRPKMRPGTQAPVLVAEAPVTSSVLPDDIQTALVAAQTTETTAVAAAAAVSNALVPTMRPEARPQNVVLAKAEPEVVTRISTSGGRHWGVNVGRYTSRYKAEKVLLQTALTEMSTLDGSLRKVVRKPTGFDANFMGMTRDSADLACRRLQARNVTCFMIGPKS